MLLFFAEYKCGCVSKYQPRASAVLGYCGRHGNGRRRLHRIEVPESEWIEEESH